MNSRFKQAGALVVPVLALGACMGGGGPVVTTPAQPIYADGTTTLADLPDGTELPLFQVGVTVDVDGFASAMIFSTDDASIVAGDSYMALKVDSMDREIVFDHATDLTIDPNGVAVWEKDVDGYSASLGLYGGRDALSYMDYGVWAIEQRDGTVALGLGVGGLETRPENIPTTGTATYDGGVIGIAANSSGAYSVLGDVSMTADFATGDVNGTFTNMFAVSASAPVATAWNDVTFNANIAAGTNEFSGTTAVTGGNVNPGGLDAGATGDIGGKFFGPGAEEVGGAWTISDGTTSAAGSFGAKQ